MKKLRQYIKSNKMSVKEFCTQNKLHYDSIRVLLYGKYRPSPDVALKIEQATNGKVTRLELLYPKNDNSKRKAA